MSFKLVTCLTREAAGGPTTHPSLYVHCQRIQRFIRHNQQLPFFFGVSTWQGSIKQSGVLSRLLKRFYRHGHRSKPIFYVWRDTVPIGVTVPLG